jgi:hypothetical protein
MLFYLIKSDYCGPWVNFDWRKLPVPKDNDYIEVRYLVAPLLYCSYLDMLASIGGYHGGIAFVNVNTSYSFTMNYDADPSFIGAIVPSIVNGTNGKKDLEWGNNGKAFIYESINTTYWHSTNMVVGHMTGAQLKNYLKGFVAVVNDTFPYYNVWRVYDNYPGNILIDNFECFNFVFNCFLQVRKFGGFIQPNLVLNASFLAAFTSETPQKVNYSDPVMKDEIVVFYETLEGKVNDLGILGFIMELVNVILNGEFFVRSNDEYYKLKLHKPYVELLYQPEKVPVVFRQRKLVFN